MIWGSTLETFFRKKRLPRRLELTDLEQEYFEGERVCGGWKNCRRVELNALSADPHRFVEWVESKLAEHGCDKKLVPPKTAIDKHAREKRDSILREQIQAAIDEYLDVEESHRSDLQYAEVTHRHQGHPLADELLG